MVKLQIRRHGQMCVWGKRKRCIAPKTENTLLAGSVYLVEGRPRVNGCLGKPWIQPCAPYTWQEAHLSGCHTHSHNFRVFLNATFSRIPRVQASLEDRIFPTQPGVAAVYSVSHYMYTFASYAAERLQNRQFGCGDEIHSAL